MYLPAMIAYALLSPLPATAAFIAFHLALSAVAAFILDRMSGLGTGGVFVAGCAFAFPWLAPAAGGMVVVVQVYDWLPVALIGIEMALRPSSPAFHLAGIALSGGAISQILASWLGQGAYYALLVIGGWVAWRTLVTAPPTLPMRDRLKCLFTFGPGVLATGVLLNAAALLIRLDANSRSSSALGAYSGVSAWADAKVGRDFA